MTKKIAERNSSPSFVDEHCPKHGPLEQLQTTPPSFVEEHRPKHEILEQLQEMFTEIPLPHEEWRRRLNDLGRPRVTTIDPVYKPKTLMEMYSIEPGHIYQDTLDRPDHYTSEQQELAESLSLGRKMPLEPTQVQLDDLFHRWVDRTQEQRREIVRKVTAPKDIADQTILEGHSAEKPNYENQDFPDLIKII